MMAIHEKAVLFVCLENSNHSQMAEAFARIHGDHYLQVYSAGSNPTGQINPKVVQAMSEMAYDMSWHRCKSLSDLPDRQFDYLITMGCSDTCQHVSALQREDWTLPDPATLPIEDFKRVRDEIEYRVFGLLNRLIA